MPYSNPERFTTFELIAIRRAEAARTALKVAIAEYASAGFGSEVTNPLRTALALVAHSLREVQS